MRVWKDIALRLRYWNWSNLLRLRPVSDTARLIDDIFRLLPLDDLDDDTYRIFVAVYDVKRGTTKYIRLTRGNAKELALASCYLPFLSHFPLRQRNINIDGRFYVDGSARDILPMDKLNDCATNVLCVANYPYYWLPDPVPLPLRTLAALTQPNGRQLFRNLSRRSARFAADRRQLEILHAKGIINLHVVGPRFVADKYPLDHPMDRRGICKVMQEARDLADSDREAFEAWVKQLPNLPPVH